MPGAEIAVAVPVRDEARRLPMLLRAMAAQCDAPPFTLALFLDNCTDDSEGVVRAMAPTLPCRIVTGRADAGGPPNAGVARARAMALACDAAHPTVLLTTDADSTPAPDWIAANLRALDHADIVAGRILHAPGRTPPVQTRLAAYLDRLYRLRRSIDPVAWDATATHHWTSGASLAMAAAVHRAVGGFPPVASGEDAAFADRAARGGHRLRRDAAVRVTTSARRDGRATGGLAASLAAWDRATQPPEVAHPADEAWRYARHAQARRAHRSGAFADLARRLHLSIGEVERVAGECRNGEAMAARIVGAPPGGMRAVTLPHAEALLATIAASHLAGAA